MNLAQIFMASLLFGFGSYLGYRFSSFVYGVTHAFIVHVHNQRAALLRLHTKHCANCIEPMLYYCPRCGHHDSPRLTEDPIVEESKKS